VATGSASSTSLADLFTAKRGEWRCNECQSLNFRAERCRCKVPCAAAAVGVGGAIVGDGGAGVGGGDSGIEAHYPAIALAPDRRADPATASAAGTCRPGLEHKAVGPDPDPAAQLQRAGHAGGPAVAVRGGGNSGGAAGRASATATASPTGNGSNWSPGRGPRGDRDDAALPRPRFNFGLLRPAAAAAAAAAANAFAAQHDAARAAGVAAVAVPLHAANTPNVEAEVEAEVGVTARCAGGGDGGGGTFAYGRGDGETAAAAATADDWGLWSLSLLTAAKPAAANTDAASASTTLPPFDSHDVAPAALPVGPALAGLSSGQQLDRGGRALAPSSSVSLAAVHMSECKTGVATFAFAAATSNQLSPSVLQVASAAAIIFCLTRPRTSFGFRVMP
jgi:hypothetical protein